MTYNNNILIQFYSKIYIHKKSILSDNNALSAATCALSALTCFHVYDIISLELS